MATVKTPVEKIKVGDNVCTPGDRSGQFVCGIVHKIEKDGPLVIFKSRDWATESSKKYGDGFGYYMARKGEKLGVRGERAKPKKR